MRGTSGYLALIDSNSADGGIVGAGPGKRLKRLSSRHARQAGDVAPELVGRNVDAPAKFLEGNRPVLDTLPHPPLVLPEDVRRLLHREERLEIPHTPPR